MELIAPKKLIRGEPYMAFVRVIPYYEQGNPVPIKITYGELIRREKREEKIIEEKELKSVQAETHLM